MNVAPPAIHHLSREELEAGLAAAEPSPADGGGIEAIVIRPEHDERQSLQSVEVSLARGMHGDHWEKGCWMTTEAGLPHPDVQICITNSRVIQLIAGNSARWPLAGDNLFVDLDVTPENLPPGTRLAVGTAVLEITAVPHNGCKKFAERFGRDSVRFVNSPEGKARRLRGIYARVAQDGVVSVGDRLGKIATE